MNESRLESSNEVRSVVSRILTGSIKPARRLERRRGQRVPYPYLVKLAPVDADGQTPLGEGFVVVGKHLSPGGIDFYHREPLPYRWVIAWLEGPEGQPFAMLVELLWCRFNKQGWYDNGGRFVRLIDEPDAPEKLSR